MEYIKGAVRIELRGIQEESFLEYIESWVEKGGKCIKFEGVYFEEENM